jgi:hypothetical protein
MRNLLVAAILVLSTSSAFGQGCMSIMDRKPVDKVEQYKKEALAITPARNWVKDLDNTNWYYGYKEGNNFYYVRTYTQSALSDLSTTYPISYRNGEMRQLPRLNFVYESYQVQFDKRVGLKTNKGPIPYQKPTKSGRGFNWMFENKHSRHEYNYWNNHKYQ